MWYGHMYMMTLNVVSHDPPLALHQLGLHDCDMIILAMPPSDFTVEKAKRLWMVKFSVSTTYT